MKDTRLNWLFFVVLAAGIAARLFVSTLGHNYDMDSWQVAMQTPVTGNVYPDTFRYPYAPGWFFVLHALYFLAGHDPVNFRFAVAAFLTLVDAGTFFILWRKFGKLAGCWFFLNPISIVLTGYHRNFDNLAIFVALLAAFLIKDEFEKPVSRQTVLGLAVLGFSLVLKHIFFIFPFWLAVKQRGIAQKLIVILIPVSIFFLSFVPYWHGGKDAIIQNVFTYKSYPTEFFYHMYVPRLVQYMFDSKGIWFFCLALFAFIYRKKTAVESLLLYTCVMTAFSPAIMNEYMAIPLCFVATNLNVFTVLYTVYGSIHELVDYNGLHLAWISSKNCIDVAIYMLFPALIWVTWRQEIVDAGKKLLKWASFETENQLGLKK
jgi:hypothetical protein